MARKKKRTNVQEASVPMESMIDVVFLLLIYFIVTQKPIVEDTLLGVNLPSGKASATQSEPAAIFTIDVTRMAMDSDKFYLVNNAPLSVEQLNQQLLSLAENDPDTTVLIKCGPNAKHKKLIKVLDMCANAGLQKLNLVESTIPYNPN